MIKAIFYDISSSIDSEYDKVGFVKMNKKDFSKKIKEYIESHPEIKEGDILFIGSDYETRQDYGFGIVLHNDIKMENYGPDLPIKYKNYLPKNISYEAILKIFEEEDEWYSLWYGEDKDASTEIKEKYIKEKLY